MSLTNLQIGAHNVIGGIITPSTGFEYHVKKTTDTNYDYWAERYGVDWPDGTAAIQASLVASMSPADDFDTVWVYPGEWKEAATVAITQDYLKVIAVELGPYGRCYNQTAIYQYGNVDTPCMSIEGANGVEVAGLWFVPYDPGTSSVGINVAQTANCRGVNIHHNYFYGVASGATGPCLLQLGVVDSFDCDAAFIYRNDFYLGGASNSSIAQLMWNKAVRGQVRENNFWHHGNTANASSIRIDDAVGMRGGIFDNRFMNIEIALKGSSNVCIANPAAAGGGVMIDGNMFINYGSDDNCVADMDDEIWGLNYNNEAVMASDT